MKVSVCITAFNEEGSIALLLDSLLQQSKKADEIVIVDAGSKDKTNEIIRFYKNVRLIISKGASIAKGRNIAVKNSKYEIIAMTDAGCICDKNWLARITKPFEKRETKVVAGFYEMTHSTSLRTGWSMDFKKALKPFLGIVPDKFDDGFLPATRSVAFRKDVWKKVDGFDEKFSMAGEDTDFNLKILENNFKIVRVKNAIVKWEMPSDLISASKKFYYYAMGDAQSGNILTRHNIKVLSIFFRYFLFILFWPLFFVYLLFPIWKFRDLHFSWPIRIWTVIIQLVSDFSVMLGFVYGIFETNN